MAPWFQLPKASNLLLTVYNSVHDRVVAGRVKEFWREGLGHHLMLPAHGVHLGVVSHSAIM